MGVLPTLALYLAQDICLAVYHSVCVEVVAVGSVFVKLVLDSFAVGW